MTETKLVSDLVAAIRRRLRSFVTFKHADRFTHGVPDIAVDGNKHSTRWEVKYANPDFESDGIQELTMLRCDNANYARYIIFVEKTKNRERQTLIITPQEFKEWESFVFSSNTDMAIDPRKNRTGFDLDWVVEKIAEAHDARLF